MKLTPLGSPFSFVLSLTSGSVGMNNNTGSLFSIFHSQQESDVENCFHIPGEYEKRDVSVYIQDIGAQYSLIKLYAEEVRLVFFSSSNAQMPENGDELFGEVDILIFDKSSEGLSDTEAKKLLEKIDPRVIIFSKESSEFVKKIGFSTQEVEDFSFSRALLPTEKTEFYMM